MNSKFQQRSGNGNRGTRSSGRGSALTGGSEAEKGRNSFTQAVLPGGYLVAMHQAERHQEG